METYSSFTVTFRNKPWLNIVCRDQKDVEQFIVDWCVSNNVRPSSDEWLIQPIDSVIAKEMLSEICGSGGGGLSDFRPTDKRFARAGELHVSINPKCWG
jgi:hypothetical protein